MKNTVTTLILMFLLASACSSATSPTPGISDLPATIPAGGPISSLAPEASFYRNEEYGFQIQVPLDYRVEELPRRKGLLLALGFAPSDLAQTQRFGFPVGLIVYEKSMDVPLLDWFSRHIGDLNEAGQPSSEEAFFYAPLIQNQHHFQGEPALQYLSGSRPVPYETLIDRGKWVIGFYYLQDYPEDFQPIYNQMLTSLELFEPTEESAVPAASSLPTSTPVACLDEAAGPRDLPPRQTPLEVQFISDGNIWVWEEESGTATQIGDTGDARSFHFSPDGKAIAFTRGPHYGQAELWAIRRDGTNLRLLASADRLHELAGEPSTTEHSYTDTVVYLQWIEGTHRLGFEIQRNYDAIGGCCESGGYWQVDVETSDLSAWTPPPEMAEAPEGQLSPDGKQVAIIGDTTLSVMNADGSDPREDVFDFETAPVSEGGGRFYPHIQWAEDSQSLLAITFSGDVFSDETPITTWRIPLDGSPAQELHKFSTVFYWVYLSPNQNYLAYLKRVQPRSNEHELYLATFDGSKDIIYATQHGLQFLHWHPDSYHFVYEQSNIFRPFLGSMCGGSIPLLDSADTPATQIEWVDATRFLYTKGSLDPLAGPRELRLGELDGTSILIGPFNGESAQYVFNIENAPLGRD